jgi:hypothetical protein
MFAGAIIAAIHDLTGGVVTCLIRSADFSACVFQMRQAEFGNASAVMPVRRIMTE